MNTKILISTALLGLFFSLSGNVKAEVNNELNPYTTLEIISANRVVSDGSYLANNVSNPPESMVQLLDARPNPANAYTWIHYYLANTNQNAQLIIRNLVGTVVHSEILDSTADRVKINTSNFANGIYIYSLIIDQRPVSSKRLIIAN